MTNHLRKILSLVALLTLTSLPANAGPYVTWVNGKRGIGGAVGYPTVVSYFQLLDDRTFLQAYIGPAYVIGLDFAVVFPDTFKDLPQVTPYIGGGGYIFTNRYRTEYRSRSFDDLGLGLRIPLGLLFQPKDVPAHFFFEIAPNSMISPEFWSYLDIQVGARYLFH